MRIKLDENLPANLAGVLAGLGHDVETVPGERLRGVPDAAVWTAAAQREGRFLITQDLDFSDVRHHEPGTHAGVVLVRLAGASDPFALRGAVVAAACGGGCDEGRSCWDPCDGVTDEGCP
jgi:predicted nuclease of predicted toxin-antitoxin system